MTAAAGLSSSLSSFDAARQNGNALVGAGKFQEAIIQYTNGLDADEHQEHPDRHILLCNRALCYLRLSPEPEPDSAFRDAVEAAEQNPRYVKAWWRLVESTAAMGQRRDVVAYFLDKVLDLDPTLADARRMKAQFAGEAFEELAKTLFDENDTNSTGNNNNNSNTTLRHDPEFQEMSVAAAAAADAEHKDAVAKKTVPFQERARALVAKAKGATWIGVSQSSSSSSSIPLGISSPEVWDKCLLVLFVLIVSGSSSSSNSSSRRHSDEGKPMSNTRDDLAALLEIVARSGQDADDNLSLRSHLQRPVIQFQEEGVGRKLWCLLHVACFAVEREDASVDSTVAAAGASVRDLSVFAKMLAVGRFDTSFVAAGMRSVLSEVVSALAQQQQKSSSTSVSKSDVEAFKLCLSNAKDIDRPDATGDGHTPLIVACRASAVPIVRQLLLSGADCNKQNRKGESAVCCAVMHGGVECLRTLLHLQSSRRQQQQKKIDLNGVKTFGDQLAPLHLAVQQQDKTLSIPLMRLLLNLDEHQQADADVDGSNSSSSSSSASSPLLFTPADVEVVNAQGQRPLHYAAMLGEVACCRFLIEVAGAQIDARCGHGMSAMDYAARGAAPRLVGEYLQKMLEKRMG